MVVVLNQSQRYSPEQYRAFQGAVGDTNPLHFDAAFAAATPFKNVLVPGFYLASLAELSRGMFHERPDGKTGVAVHFQREIRATIDDQPGDAVTLLTECPQSIAQYQRTRDGQTKQAIDIRAHAVESIDALVGEKFRHATDLDSEVLRKVYGQPLPKVPYLFAAAIIAPALLKFKEGIFGAYTEVTVLPQRPAPTDCTLIATAVLKRSAPTRSGMQHRFQYTVQMSEPPRGFATIVCGTATVLELTATHK